MGRQDSSELEGSGYVIQRIIDLAVDKGNSPEDEDRLGQIEALARSYLGQSHGVWDWRVESGSLKKLLASWPPEKRGEVTTPEEVAETEGLEPPTL